MDHEKVIEEDLIMQVGLGATKSVGSDSYPYFISEILANGVIGIYRPNSCFDDKHPWQAGELVVDEFNPDHPTEMYIKRCYGHWWEVDKNGKRIQRFDSRYVHFSLGHAYSYQDPSF